MFRSPRLPVEAIPQDNLQGTFSGQLPLPDNAWESLERQYRRQQRVLYGMLGVLGAVGFLASSEAQPHHAVRVPAPPTIIDPIPINFHPVSINSPNITINMGPTVSVDATPVVISINMDSLGTYVNENLK
jgi:hypothetical protein